MARPQTLKDSLPGVRRLFRYIRPKLAVRHGLVAGSLGLLLAETGLRLLEPWPIKFIVDGLLGEEPSGVELLDRLDPMTLLTFMCAAVVVITGARALAAYGNTIGFALLGNQIVTELSNELYRHLQRLSLSFHTKARSGDLVVRAIGDVAQLKEMAVTAFLPAMGNLLILAGMLGVMLWLNWQLALATLATVPLFSLFALRRSRRIQEVARTQRRQEGAMASTAVQSIVGIKVVQALSLDRTFADAFSTGNQKNLKEGVKIARLTASLERSVDVLMAVATALVLWFGARAILSQTLTTGELLVFLFYLKSAFKLFQNFAKHTARMAKASAAGERVLEVLEKEPEIRDLPGASEAPRFKGSVRFVNVGFEYEPGHSILHDINLKARAGQRIAMVGPSGHGKSTLAGLLLRLYDPTRGQVLIDGRDLRCYTVDSLRRQVSVVLQDTLLFAASIHDNIAYGASVANRAEVEDAARLAYAHDFIMALPEGYDTVVGERGTTLSNGQRQRIAIARAAIRNAPIIILDEPTTGLDQENERLVMAALERLMEGKTSFLITHRLDQARRADQIVVVQEGRIAEIGTHAELLQAGWLYAALYRLQHVTQQLPAGGGRQRTSGAATQRLAPPRTDLRGRPQP